MLKTEKPKVKPIIQGGWLVGWRVYRRSGLFGADVFAGYVWVSQ